MKLMHNGILEVDHVRPEEVTQLDDYLPSSWFGPFTENSLNLYLALNLFFFLNNMKTKVFENYMYVMLLQKRFCVPFCILGSYVHSMYY